MMGRDGMFGGGMGLAELGKNATQGRCGLLVKKLPASPGEKFPVEMNPSLPHKDDTPQQSMQTHIPSGSQSHTCLQSTPAEMSWWKQEPMIDMETMDCPSATWVENYQDLSSWCSSAEAPSYLWPTTDEGTTQPVEFQGEIDFDLRESEEIASVPLQEDSWGAENTGNMSFNLPPVPEDRWGLNIGNTTTTGITNQTAKPPEPVLVNDCWLLDIEHEEVVKGDSESGNTDYEAKSVLSNQGPAKPSTLVDTKQAQPNYNRRAALSSGGFNVKVETDVAPEKAAVKAPLRTSGKLNTEQGYRKPVYSSKKLEQKEVQRPVKVEPPQRAKDRAAAPDVFEEVHRKVVAMTAKSAAAAAVKKENVPVATVTSSNSNRIQKRSTLPRLDLNIDPLLIEPEPGQGTSNQGISTPEVLKSLDMGEGFDLLSYLFDDKAVTPPVSLDSCNPNSTNPFHFPHSSIGKPNIRDLPGFRTHNQTPKPEEDEKSVGVVRPMFAKKIDLETECNDEESSQDKSNTSVVVELQPQLLPPIHEEERVSVGRKRRLVKEKDITIRIYEPRMTRKKQLNYRRDDDETSLGEDDDDDYYYMKDDENDEDFTLGSTSKRRKRRTSESSNASKRSRTSCTPVKRNQDRKTSTSSEADRYRELRDRNNEASRKSRLTRKAREQELMSREKELSKENEMLKVKTEEMENLVKRLREALLQSMMKK